MKTITGLRQNTVQTQSLELTQKLSLKQQQSLKVLELPLTELSEFISMELEKNPALSASETNNQESYTSLESSDTDYTDIFENSSDTGCSTAEEYADRTENLLFKTKTTENISREGAEKSDKFNTYLESVISQSDTLHEHLLNQLGEQQISDREYQIGEILISDLDDRGFRQLTDSELFKEYDFEQDVIEKIITMIQHFDPIGTCTKDFIESLLIQAYSRPDAPEEAFIIIEKFLPDIGKKNYSKIQKAAGISREQIDQALIFIQTLNPYQGKLYSSNANSYIIPDLFIDFSGEKPLIEINDNAFPKLSVEKEFQEYSKSSGEIRKYAREHINSALEIIESIQRREQTIYRIGEFIAYAQKDFFREGKKALKPLKQKDMAQELKLDESTISRAVNKKYVRTPDGIFPLTVFFSTGGTSSAETGEALSKAAIIEEIKEIKEEYTGTKKLSAQKIADMLEERGIKIARRTVSKYLSDIE